MYNLFNIILYTICLHIGVSGFGELFADIVQSINLLIYLRVWLLVLAVTSLAASAKLLYAEPG